MWWPQCQTQHETRTRCDGLNLKLSKKLELDAMASNSNSVKELEQCDGLKLKLSKELELNVMASTSNSSKKLELDVMASNSNSSKKLELKVMASISNSARNLNSRWWPESETQQETWTRGDGLNLKLSKKLQLGVMASNSNSARNLNSRWWLQTQTQQETRDSNCSVPDARTTSYRQPLSLNDTFTGRKWTTFSSFYLVSRFLAAAGLRNLERRVFCAWFPQVAKVSITSMSQPAIRQSTLRVCSHQYVRVHLGSVHTNM